MKDLENMEISYHREMKKNYLMISVEEFREQGFETRMLIGNAIQGLLKFRIRKTDDRCQFCYEITSKQPLGRLLETKSIRAGQIRSLLWGISQTLSRMEEYLLTEEQILLTPDFIYVDPETFRPELCLLPGKEGDFPKEFSEFLQFLLDKVDHQDKEAVVMVYGLYRESLKENYGLDNLLRWLMREDSPGMEKGKQEEVPDSGRRNEGARDEMDVEGEIGELERRAAERRQTERRETERRETERRKTERNEIVWEQEQRRQEQKLQRSDNRGRAARRALLFGMILPALFGGTWALEGMAGVERLLTQDILPVAVCGLVSLAGVIITLAKGDKHGADEETFYQKQEIKKRDGKRIPVRKQGLEETLEAWTEDRPVERTRNKADEGAAVRTEKKIEDWQMVFCEEEEDDGQPEVAETPDPEDDTHTVLLWSREQKQDVRRLVSEDGKTESIEILYYPFLIGKQENLTDYILSSDTVSRLHVRIDRSGEHYSLTDLNSTNGTFLNGKRLETNESVDLNVGDKVGIADMTFWFR